ncbi:major facilitator superfamily domain-containing protein 4A [Eurytemora carolleeae]|uniref:major facilitator superfamily domain-containing protein 4A n=1 Tax=Eurytemora carolleeae TaxID=1294199 RepID=UPI000C75799C|nr:major facilitator superfamily domain-containing protein 4A [Eurytemora carolleeae]|eukprot:XP_023330392.1 major facilitator superfamily domain-containing protein 4A-like [Eurytemora affinis]
MSSLNIFAGVPLPVILKTLCLWVCFFSIALCDSVRGPTLLDVRDEVGVSTQAMSYTFMLAAIGGLGGCIVAGILLDRFATSTLYLVLLFRLQNICLSNILNQLQHPDIPTIDHFLSYQILIILLRTENFSLRLNKKIKNGFLIFHKCKIVVG